jgi:disulfide bond formation protein DsbB
MDSIILTMNTLWSALSVVAQILSVGILLSLFVPKLKTTAFARFFQTHGLTVAFIAALLATAGSLIYSDLIGYEPCKLCWFQRIFIYPQVILFGMALWRKDYSIKLYGIVLATIGGLIAVFHYVGQLGWNPFGLECLAIGYSSSCAKNFVLQFGYITIPMMAISACALIALSLWISLRKESVGGESNLS